MYPTAVAATNYRKEITVLSPEQRMRQTEVARRQAEEARRQAEEARHASIKQFPVSYQINKLCSLSLSAYCVRREAYKKHKKLLRGEKKDKAAYKIKKAGYKDLKKALGKNYDFFKKAELRRRIQSLSFLATQIAKIHNEFEKEVVDVLKDWRDNGIEPEIGFYGLAWKVTKCRKAVEQMLRAAHRGVVLKVEVDTDTAMASGLADVTEADRPGDEADGEEDVVPGGVVKGV